MFVWASQPQDPSELGHYGRAKESISVLYEVDRWIWSDLRILRLSGDAVLLFRFSLQTDSISSQSLHRVVPMIHSHLVARLPTFTIWCQKAVQVHRWYFGMEVDCQHSSCPMACRPSALQKWINHFLIVQNYSDMSPDIPVIIFESDLFRMDYAILYELLFHPPVSRNVIIIPVRFVGKISAAFLLHGYIAGGVLAVGAGVFVFRKKIFGSGEGKEGGGIVCFGCLVNCWRGAVLHCQLWTIYC